MIFVDTSVWISYFRDADRQLTAHLQSLLEEDEVALPIPVKLEILSGTPSRDFARLRRVLAALPVFFPSEDTWMRVESWIEQAGPGGERFGIADLLIAALAAEREAPLWSLDRDFARMRKLHFIRLHQPPGISPPR